MGTVIHVEFKSKDNEYENAMSELVQALRKVIDLSVGTEASFSQKEVATLAASNQASRQFFEQTLQEMADGYDDDLLIDGVRYKRSHKPGQGNYHSLCGPLKVRRATYRLVGERNGPTVVPLELEAGLVEHATRALSYSIILDYANGTSREYIESMSAAHRQVPSRSTVERIGIAVGTKANETAPSIERYLRLGESVPDEACAMSLGLDRTSVPYEEKREEGQPPKTRRKSRTKPYVRKQPDPVDVNYHMDYVATFCLVDSSGENLVTRKYSATHQEGPDGIVKQLIADVRNAIRLRPDLNVGVVQDGAAELWKLLRDALDAEPSIDEYEEAIDRYHLSERLGEVLTVLEPEDEERAWLFEQWECELNTDDAAIDRIYDFIHKRLAHYSGVQFETLDETLTYMENNGDRMRYASMIEMGLPIGSGVTEGTCKSLAGARVKRSGQRWHDAGVSAVLTLRSIHQSDRLPRFWNHLHRRYTAKVIPVEELAA